MGDNVKNNLRSGKQTTEMQRLGYTYLACIGPSQHPKKDCLDNNVPFAIGRELIVDVPIDPCGFADMYINDTTGLTVNLPGTLNADRLEAAIPLAIKVAARPNDINEPIPREPMVAQDKLKTEGGLAKLKVILG